MKDTCKQGRRFIQGAFVGLPTNQKLVLFLEGICNTIIVGYLGKVMLANRNRRKFPYESGRYGCKFATLSANHKSK